MSLTKKVFPFYQVKRGENLNVVAKKNNIDATQILLKNNLSPKQIKEGVFLRLD